MEFVIYFFIYHWDDVIDKSKCFDYGDFVTAREIEDNIGADVGIVPTLMDNVAIRDYNYVDNNKVCTELVKILRSTMFDRDLKINKGPMSITGPLAIMFRFLQKLEHCSDDNVQKTQSLKTF